MNFPKAWPIQHFSPAVKTSRHRTLHYLSNKSVHYNYRHYVNMGREFILRPNESFVAVICNTFATKNEQHNCEYVTQDVLKRKTKGFLITNTGENNFIMKCPHQTSLYSLFKFPNLHVCVLKK
jgi:hypothetical protein